jgi:hypothetical protein
MNSSDYGLVSRPDLPDKMNESMSVPPLICRDVRATKRRFNCVNGNTFNTAGTEIRIPIAGNFVLGAHNTNLNFKLQFAGTAGATAVATADFSWHAMFSQVRIESGAGSSIILEQIDEPGLLAAFIGQYTYTQEDLQKENAKGMGCKGLPSSTDGLLVKTGTDLVLTNADITLNLSTVLGLFSTSLPLYSTNGITVVLTLNQYAASGVFGAGISGLSAISNIYITANCLEGGEKYERELNDAKTKNGEVSVMFNTVRRYVQTVAVGSASGGTNLLINDRAKSCLGFFAVSRKTNELLSSTVYKNSSSNFPSWTNHNYNIAGQMYPMAGVSTIGEAIDEAYDTMQHLSKTKGLGGVISRTQAVLSTAYDADENGNSGIVAVNLSKCSADENVWGKGINLSGSNLSNYLNVTYTPVTDPCTVTIYSIFQMKVHIDKMGGFSTEF